MIQLKDLSFTYPGADCREVLRSVNLKITDGEWVALTGRNGSGKSTLCRLITGLYRPTRGSVEVDGSCTYDSGRLDGEGVAVGIAFQNPDSQFVTSTVRRELLFGMENIGLDAGEMGHRLEAAVSTFGLGGYLDRNPHTLSGGEKQRALLAAVWAMRPRHLILDEPFSFLDRRSRWSCLEVVRGSFAGNGRTVIWSTLEPGEIALADRVIYIEEGVIAFDGRPDDLAGVIPDGVLAEPLTHGRKADACESIERSRSVIDVTEASFSPEGGDFILNVSGLSLCGGETLGVAGPSGSGKTTLLLGCSGLLPPLKGEVKLLGKRIRSKRDFPKGRVAFLFQTPEEGFFAPTVHEEVALGHRNFGGNGGEDKAVADALERVGLDPERFAHRSPFRLSQGERRLVAVASMLVLPAEVFLLDEPTLFLDGTARSEIGDALCRLRSSGVSIITASHESEFLEGFTDRLITLDNGMIVTPV
ncbi:MAG: ATP-binding cassette domain-containing protein [Candidatus Krumholzibacteria bacterium]|nr:ATP-binding cassette domain-containing protein [Candidatus Krumholzibacteria bacterium]